MTTGLKPGTRVRDDTGTFVYLGTVARANYARPYEVIVEWDAQRDGRWRTSVPISELEVIDVPGRTGKGE